MSAKKPHSFDVLDDIRDYWWSTDFLALIAKRWKLNQVHSMLDVGCGMGHWGQILSPYLAKNGKIVGIDPEKIWIKKAIERAHKKKIACTQYQIGTAEAIPFPDNFFDMVTCQTVLIHVKDVALALNEMKRVLKPGGLLAVAEPNNLVPLLVFNNLNFNDSINDIINLVRFHLICERGRERQGKGNFFRGDIIPSYFYQADLNNIQICLSDVSDYFIPPYHTQRERLALADLNKDTKESWKEIRKEWKQCFLRERKSPSEFRQYWNLMTKNKNRLIRGYQDKIICSPGGVMMYLISGRKKKRLRSKRTSRKIK